MKDAFWFQHDSNARSDSRILELRAEMGWEGYGLWWALVEQLREATDYQLSNVEMRGLAMGLAISKPEARKFVDLCIELGLLTVEGDHFHAVALRRRMERWDTKREALSAAGKRGAGKRWAGDKPGATPPQAPPEPPQKPTNNHPDSQAIATPLATPPISDSNKRREEKSTEEPLPSVEGAGSEEAEIEPWLAPLPESQPDEDAPGGATDVVTLIPSQGGRWGYQPTEISESLVLPFETPAFRAAWVAYRTFREEDKQRQLTGGMQEQELLRKLSNMAGGNQQRAIDIITQTIAKGWKDLYKLDEQRPSTQQQPGQSGGGQKPTLNAVAMAGTLASRRFNQPGGSAGDTGQTTGAHPGQGTGGTPGFGPN